MTQAQFNAARAGMFERLTDVAADEYVFVRDDVRGEYRCKQFACPIVELKRGNGYGWYGASEDIVKKYCRFVPMAEI